MININIITLTTNLVNDWSRKTGCRNSKLRQEMELSAYVWKLGGACAHEEDNMKQTKTTGWYTLNWWIGIKDL